MWGCAEGVDSKSPPPCAAPSRDIWTDLSNLETVFLTFSESSKQTEELDPFQTDSIPSHIFLSGQIHGTSYMFIGFPVYMGL